MAKLYSVGVSSSRDVVISRVGDTDIAKYDISSDILKVRSSLSIY